MRERPIGITSTVPSELIYAAGFYPVDLNNEFISSPDPKSWVDEAEEEGFPHNLCAWIKGIYVAVKKRGIKRVAAVTQGDCSNTHVLMEILQSQGVETIPFAYPYPRDMGLLRGELMRFADYLGTDLESGLKIKKRLDPIRKKVASIDRLTWEGDVVSGEENHLIQVAASDMKGDPRLYERELDDFIALVAKRSPEKGRVRIGYMGVPTVLNDLYTFLEALGCSLVYNEVQRQFAMPFETETLEEQYYNYTYPYGIGVRLSDISQQVAGRRISGLIHYVQSFCFRQMEEFLVKKNLGIPILLLEGDTPDSLDGRSKTRIEGFVEILENKSS